MEFSRGILIYIAKIVQMTPCSCNKTEDDDDNIDDEEMEKISRRCDVIFEAIKQHKMFL